MQEFYRALGLGFDQLRTYQPRPASQIYPGRVAVLAVAGDRASAAAALMINFPVFGKAMAKVQAGLMRHYGLTPSQISFVSFAAKPLPPSFEVEGLAEISRGLQEGACPHDVRTQVRLIQEAEFSFWKAASEPPGSRLEPLSSGRSGR